MLEKEQKLVSLDELKLNPTEDVILILGSEGEGVSRTIARLANHKVIIPPRLQMSSVGKYPYNMIDSLNVGVTSALMLYHVKHMMNR
jgi:tRNA G18 (ribose-2'-O)-methylase SpoU